MFAKLQALATSLIHGAEHNRAYFYRLAVTVGTLLVGLHFITTGTLSTVLVLVGAVLGVGSSGLAATNTSTKKPAGEGGALQLGTVVTVLVIVVLALVIAALLGHPVHISL